MGFTFTIRAQDASDAFWGRLVECYQNDLDLARAGVRGAKHHENSIPPAAMAALSVLCAAVQPKMVIEVGTFIGNSTRILAKHAARVYTCDMSNDIKMGLPHVTQFPRQTSTQMLRLLTEPADLFFLDGRLHPDDVPLIGGLSTPETLFALDDCEGFEKGVVNALMLTQGSKRQMLYVPPPSQALFTAFGIVGRHTIGLLVPADKLVFSQQ